MTRIDETFGRGVVYTAVTANKDVLSDPAFVVENVDYLAFVDDVSRHDCKTWQMRPLAYQNDDPARRSRRPKILPHDYLAEYDWSLWIDGNIDFIASPARRIDDHLRTGSLYAFRHAVRSCAYEEFAVVLGAAVLDIAEIVERQLARYRADGFPAHLPFSTNAVILRKHGDPHLVRVMERWWAEMEAGSRRDQLSLNYAMWKEGWTAPHIFDADQTLRGSPDIRRRPHAYGYVPAAARDGPLVPE